MKFIKNLFNKKEVETKEEVKAPVAKKEKKRTMPDVNGKELYRQEKEKRRAKAAEERKIKSEQEKIARQENIKRIKEEEEQKRLEREAKKAKQAEQKQEVKATKEKKVEVKEEKLDLFGYEVEMLKHHMVVDVEILNQDNTNYYVRVANNYQEAVLPKTETTKEFTNGETTKVIVYKFYAEEYYVSQKRVEQKELLTSLNEKFTTDSVVNGTITGYDNGFFAVELADKVKAEVHQSKVDIDFVDENNAEKYLNQNYDFKITKKKTVRNQLILELNRRDLIEAKRQEEFAAFNIGDRIKLTELTANRGGLTFIQHGFDCFIPLSEVSHYFYKNSNEALNDIEQDINELEAVIIEKRDQRQQTIICSIKQTQQSPWEFIAENYHVGDELTRDIDQKKDYGLFFEIDAHIKGLLHKNEMSSELLNEYDNVAIGDTVTFIIKDIDAENERIALTNIQE